MNYGRAIRIARVARGLSQKELASMAKLDASYVSLLESEKREPSGQVLASLADVLRAPVYLLTLMASENRELRNISTEEAQVLGRHLLDMLVDGEGSKEANAVRRKSPTSSRVRTTSRGSSRS